ncbi:MAG: transcription antitermination factor NusB [Gammaproteobacteria bacterium]|nr:transcription antitermination factor NusB [Gammaproteobacteria bacterium]NND53650.1 transcription antitermination factor NusB [Gammaproteobacteria bacterium]
MKKSGRQGARQLAVQALYQAQISAHEHDELTRQFKDDPGYGKCEQSYFEQLLDEAFRHREHLDNDISEFGDIPPAQLDPVEHAVLWIALAELRFHDDVPVPVVINEAIELTKIFGAEGGHRFVNGLLDKAGRSLRPAA